MGKEGYWADASDPLAQRPGFEKFKELNDKYLALMHVALFKSGNIEEAEQVRLYASRTNPEVWEKSLQAATEEYEQCIQTARKLMASNTPVEQDIPPYQQRVVDEKAELDDKIEKLAKFVYGDTFTNVETDERVRLYRQLVVMKHYAKILGERIAAF